MSQWVYVYTNVPSGEVWLFYKKKDAQKKMINDLKTHFGMELEDAQKKVEESGRWRNVSNVDGEKVPEDVVWYYRPKDETGKKKSSYFYRWRIRCMKIN